MTQPTGPYLTPEALPPGEYAVVYFFDNATMVGRIAEIERYGGKLLSMEVLHGGEFLPPALHSAGAISHIIPCSAKLAWNVQRRRLTSPPASDKSGDAP